MVVILGLAIILFVLYPGLTLPPTPASNRVGYRRGSGFPPRPLVIRRLQFVILATLPVTMSCARDRLGAEEGI